MAIIHDFKMRPVAVQGTPTGNAVAIGEATPISGPKPVRVKPLQASADTIRARLAICARCENNRGGNCRLFACCTKNLAQTVAMALEKCPAGHWQMEIPQTLKKP